MRALLVLLVLLRVLESFMPCWCRNHLPLTKGAVPSHSSSAITKLWAVPLTAQSKKLMNDRPW